VTGTEEHRQTDASPPTASGTDVAATTTARLQVALDFSMLSRAKKAAAEAVAAGADLLEVGTPLLKSEGLDAVRALHAEFPAVDIVADTKTMDAGRAEMEMASKAGAAMATVLGVASDTTIRECAEVARNYGIEVIVDLVEHPDPVARAKQVAALGATAVGVHCPIDQQMLGKDPFDTLRAVREAVDIKVTVAGGLNSETAAKASALGADVVIIGGAITKAPDANAATAELLSALRSGQARPATAFKRFDADKLVEAFGKVSTPNISDALHRGGFVEGLTSVVPGKRAVGRAVTCRTYPGDWAKPVEAIDACEAGDILVIDAGGRPPAVWGELATESCIQKGIAAVIIDGAIRDVDAIRELGFPAWSRQQVPHAWEPKGLGEIGTPITIGHRPVRPGDWVIADDSGVVVVPAERAVETANRALDVLEMENRVRQEIRAGSTLSQVIELYRWEKSGH
jgi:3-hexulose-6-phosphate synthase/6-phospho-3-hexuloisomerase